jgi:hypothetical protein
MKTGGRVPDFVKRILTFLLELQGSEDGYEDFGDIESVQGGRRGS